MRKNTNKETDKKVQKSQDCMFVTPLNCLVFAVMKHTAKISQLVCGSYNANHDLLQTGGQKYSAVHSPIKLSPESERCLLKAVQ